MGISVRCQILSELPIPQALLSPPLPECSTTPPDFSTSPPESSTTHLSPPLPHLSPPLPTCFDFSPSHVYSTSAQGL